MSTRNVIYAMMTSLDGFIEGPNRELDWAIIDDELHTFINNRQRAVDTYLYGRRMYDLMVAHWPTADTNPAAPAFVVEFAQIWKTMPKVVFSTTLDEVEWNARLVRDNIADEIVMLKAQPGKDMALGGASIAATFMRLGLIDEYHTYVHPVVLGSGTPMFQSSDHTSSLRLVETHTFCSGVIYLRYQRAGAGQS